jgi:hypothetical protein
MECCVVREGYTKAEGPVPVMSRRLITPPVSSSIVRSSYQPPKHSPNFTPALKFMATTKEQRQGQEVFPRCIRVFLRIIWARKGKMRQNGKQEARGGEIGGGVGSTPDLRSRSCRGIRTPSLSPPWYFTPRGLVASTSNNPVVGEEVSLDATVLSPGLALDLFLGLVPRYLFLHYIWLPFSSLAGCSTRVCALGCPSRR